MKRLASRLTWWPTAAQQGSYWHRHAQERKPDLHPGRGRGTDRAPDPDRGRTLRGRARRSAPGADRDQGLDRQRMGCAKVSAPGRGGKGTRASAAEGRHRVPGEPAQLLLELLGREALGPVDHEVFQARTLGLDRHDALDHMLRWPAKTTPSAGCRRRVSGGGRGLLTCPCAPLLAGVAHEPEGREPLVTLVVRGLDAALGDDVRRPSLRSSGNDVSWV